MRWTGQEVILRLTTVPAGYTGGNAFRHLSHVINQLCHKSIMSYIFMSATPTFPPSYIWMRWTGLWKCVKIKQNWKLIEIVMPGIWKWYLNQARPKTYQNRDAMYRKMVSTWWCRVEENEIKNNKDYHPHHHHHQHLGKLWISMKIYVHRAAGNRKTLLKYIQIENSWNLWKSLSNQQLENL